MMGDLDFPRLAALIDEALAEDLGGHGDLSSDGAVPDSTLGQAALVAKESGVLAGLPVAQAVFHHVDRHLEVDWRLRDGDGVQAGDVVGHVRGRLQTLLTAERTALNFVQRLSGIATVTAQYVKAVQGTGAVVLDTRKTTPAFRVLEKYAVRMGGGTNHRFGLFDMVMIKDNHIDAAGGIGPAVEGVRSMLAARGLSVPIEVETRNLDEVAQALAQSVDRIMLDNMSLEMMGEAVGLVAGRVPLEASGNVTLERIRAIAETGVNFISVGALTHSVKALDLSLRIVGE